MMTGLQLARGEPWLDENDAIPVQMVPETTQGLLYPIKRLYVADGAEQTENHIVACLKLKIGHVAIIESPRRVFGARNAKEGRIEVESVDCKSVMAGQKPGVLARPTPYVEHRSIRRIDRA